MGPSKEARWHQTDLSLGLDAQRFGSSIHPITYISQRNDPPSFSTDFAAQTANINIHDISQWVRIESPYRVENALSRQNPAGICQEKQQQIGVPPSGGPV